MEPARLRKAFKFPADEDSDSQPEDLDEEEQEELIKTFVENDATKTEAYKKAFLALPVLSLFLYIPTLLHPTTTNFLPTILSFTSLSCTIYILYTIPSRPTSSQPKPSSTFLQTTPPQSPLEKYLPHLNATLCIVLLLAAWRAKLAGAEREEEMYLSILPPVVFLIIYVARTQLKPVDVGELEKLKYGYKGA